MVSKFYAVKKGRKQGVYTTWDECRVQVEGFRGAIYKAFSSYDEAYSFISSDYIGNEKDNEKDIIKSNKIGIEVAEAYVDGSYSDEYKMYSYGVVVVHKNEVIKFSGSDNQSYNISMRNVAGELLGAIEAIKWALKNEIEKINIYYDYEGIEKWALGLWKANKTGTKYYKDFFDSINKKLVVSFTKVKAHTGVLYNEEADRLAKSEFSNIRWLKKDTLENKYINVFNRIIYEEENEKTKNECSTVFRGYIITDKKLKKISKEIWKMNNKKISEINSINTILNVDEKILIIKIEDVYKEIYKYEIVL